MKQFFMIRNYICFVFLFFMCQIKPLQVLGGMSISQELFDWIRCVLPEGSTILECGSGYGSAKLAEHYTVYSIEHDRRWVNKYKEPNYIYAPIIKRWYSVKAIQDNMPEHYDMILVDGPLGRIGRGGFFNNLDLFKTDGVIIVFDDINRKAEWDLMIRVGHALNRTPQILLTDPHVGYLLPSGHVLS